MKKRTPISKIMTTDIVTINTSQQLIEAYKIIENKNIRHLPVVSGDQIVGMLSKTDIDKASFISAFDDEEINTAIYENLSIEQVMTKKIISVQSEDNINDVAQVLASNEFHAVPVLEDDKLVGIVSTTDLINYLISLF